MAIGRNQRLAQRACSALQEFEGHPLLIRALAGEIARDRRSPRDFDKWKECHPAFNPFGLPMVKSDVLAYALEGLGPEELALLRAIAGFRMPAPYETLAALLVGEDRLTRPFSSEDDLDRALAGLDGPRARRLGPAGKPLRLASYLCCAWRGVD